MARDVRRGFVHVFRYDPGAVRVPPRGNPLGQKYAFGALKCVMCTGVAEFLAAYDLDHGADCPGRVLPATGSLGVDLKGSR